MKCVCGHDIEEHWTEYNEGGCQAEGCLCSFGQMESSLRARIAEMRKVLVDREWILEMSGTIWCPDCQQKIKDDHTPDCSYAALLKESEE